MEPSNVAAHAPEFACTRFIVTDFGYRDGSFFLAEEDQIRHDLNVSLFYKEDLKRVKILVRVALLAPRDANLRSEPEQLNVGHLTVESNFSLRDFDDYFERDHINLPRSLRAELYAATLDGARGALAAMMRGTPLAEHVLPPIDIDALLEAVSESDVESTSVRA